MRILAVAVLALAVTPVASAQEGKVDRQKLKALRKMTPEQRQELRRRLAELKSLPPAERERLRENLRKLGTMGPEALRRAREKARQLDPEERRAFVEMAGGFFRWSRRMGYQEGFPRGAFFQWLKSERPDRLAAIRGMAPDPALPRVDRRVDEFVKLYHEFRPAMLTRLGTHVRRHGCADPAAVEALRDASPREFWPRWQDLAKSCPQRRTAPPKK